MKKWGVVLFVAMFALVWFSEAPRQQAEVESTINDSSMPRNGGFGMETGDAEYLFLKNQARKKTEKANAEASAAPEEKIETVDAPVEQQVVPQATPQDEPQDEPQEIQQVEAQAAAPAAGEIPGEVELMACVVWSEAGNQDMTGMRLIVSTILNRVETPGFPDTVIGVITEPSQYVYGSYYNQECIDAVLMELEQRTDYNVLWFWATGFPPYGTPLYQHGGHYFSGKPL